MVDDFGLTNNMPETSVVQEDLNPLPRSVQRNTPYGLLDGEWSFTLDLEERGLSEMWYLGHEYARSASFPCAIDEWSGKLNLTLFSSPCQGFLP